MPGMHRIDSLDARIILALDRDPSATVLALAQTLGVARNTVHARLRRLADGEVLRAFSRRVDPRALGYDLAAFVELSIRQGAGDEALDGLRSIPEIIEIHATTGNADLLVRAVAQDTADLHRVTSRMLEIPGVLRTNTSISLLEVMPLRLTELLRRAAGDA